MLANHNNFEEKLRKKLEGAEMTPPPNLWSKIDKQLQYEPPKKTTDYRSFYLGAAAAFFLCILSAGLYHFISPENAINKPSYSQQEIAEKSKKQPNIASDKQETPYNYKEVNQNVPNLTNVQKAIPSESYKEEIKKEEIIQENNAFSVKRGGLMEIAHNTPPPSANIAQNLGEPENKPTENTVLPLKKEKEESDKGVNAGDLAVKMHLNTPQKHFIPENKASFANQLADIEPIKFDMPIKSTKNIADLPLNTHLEMPLTAKNKKISAYVNAGMAKVYYNNGNDNARYAWNKLGISSVRGINEASEVLSVETPRQINALTDYSVKNVQLSILNYDEHIGGGLQYKLNRLFGFSSGLNLHHQRVKKVELPYDYVQDYRPAIFNTKNNWFKDKNSSFVSNNANGSSVIEIDNKDLFILEIPLMANFSFPIKRSTITASLGASYRKLLSGKGLAKNENGLKAQTSKVVTAPAYTANNATLNARLEYQYQVTTKNAVFAAATAEWFATPFYPTSQASQRLPKLLGMETGMKF